MHVLLLLAAAASLTPPAPPANQVPPTITGKAKRGGTLTASPGEWTGTAPIEFTYQWMRCHPYCGKVQGATGQSYTLTKADAVRSPTGEKTYMSVYVTATNSYGSVAKLVEPPVAVAAPLPRPRNETWAQLEAMVIPEKASTIPQILAHNGYRAWYFPVNRGRVTVKWTRSSSDPDAPALAFGHRTFRHRHKGAHFKVRLTKRGRRLLQHHRHVHLITTVFTLPLHGYGGNGSGSGLSLRTKAPSVLDSV
jgi:hypothetical protein